MTRRDFFEKYESDITSEINDRFKHDIESLNECYDMTQEYKEALYQVANNAFLDGVWFAIPIISEIYEKENSK